MNTNNAENCTFLSLMSPMTNRRPPRRIGQVGQSYNLKGKFNISSNLKQWIKNFEESQFSQNMSQNYLLGCRNPLELWCLFSSDLLRRKISYRTEKNWNLIVCHVSGPTEPLLFKGWKTMSVHSWVPSSKWVSTTFMGSSYWGEWRLQLSVDEAVQLDGKRFMRYFESELQNALKTYSS